MKKFLLNVGYFLSLISSCLQPITVESLPINNSNNYQVQNHQSGIISYRRIGIGGVNLSMSETQVRKILGKPKKVKNIYVAIAGNTRNLEYTGITVKLLEDSRQTTKFSVYEIETNSYKYPTLDGIKVGDQVSKIIKVYGKPQGQGYESSKVDMLSYSGNIDSPSFLNFSIENGKVKTIFCGDFLG